MLNRVVLLVAIMSGGSIVAQQNEILTDDFNRADNASLGTTNNGLTWTEGGVSASPEVNGNEALFLTNATVGNDWATVDLSSIAPAWNSTLTNNTGPIEWRFNMRIFSNKLGGFSFDNNGVAYILASNSSDPNTGEGYAVVIGNPGAGVRPLRLVHYTGGLDDNANITNIMFDGDFSSGEFLAVLVQYDPISDKWGLAYASSPTSFPDPLTATYTFVANFANTTYTSTPGFQYTGMLHNHRAGLFIEANFDNITISQQWVLPITLTTFEGLSTSNGVELAWETASETNNDFYSIEHSTDGLTFREVGTLPGAGTTLITSNYSFLHRDAVTGLQYYRLKQTDFNGQFEYSEVIAVNHSGKLDQVNLFPNPVSADVLEMNFNSLTAGSYQIDLFNQLGQRTAGYTLDAAEGFNTSRMDVSQMPPGIYFLRISAGEFSEQYRIAID